MDRYGWVKEFTDELKKLDESQPDYEQVLQLRKLEDIWKEKERAVYEELTREADLPYIIRMRNEATKAVYDYICTYISGNEPLEACLEVSTRFVHQGRLSLRISLKQGLPFYLNGHGISKAADGINYLKVLQDVIKIEWGGEGWATKSVYEVFKRTIQADPEWIRKYCIDITRTIDLIDEELQKKGDLVQAFLFLQKNDYEY